MPSKDDLRTVAKRIRRHLDEDKLAFKTYQREAIATVLKGVGGAHGKGGSPWRELEVAFKNEELLAFPPSGETAEDGYTRIYRSGPRIAGILNAIRFPGGGSDEELAGLLGRG